MRLPVDEKDPVTRLTRVRTAMDRNKEAGPHRGAGAVALLAEHVPPLGHRLGGPLLGQAARLWFDVLVTSVPLPGFGLLLAATRSAPCSRSRRSPPATPSRSPSPPTGDGSTGRWPTARPWRTSACSPAR
ncbi:hypothetical protein SALBM217S_01271 [Streptomyces griseoloalbus]